MEEEENGAWPFVPGLCFRGGGWRENFYRIWGIASGRLRGTFSVNRTPRGGGNWESGGKKNFSEKMCGGGGRGMDRIGVGR